MAPAVKSVSRAAAWEVSFFLRNGCLNWAPDPDSRPSAVFPLFSVSSVAAGSNLDYAIVSKILGRVAGSSSRAEFEIQGALSGADTALSAKVASAAVEVVTGLAMKYGCTFGDTAFVKRLADFGLICAGVRLRQMPWACRE